MPAIRVITITLEHLKKLMLQQIDQKLKHPNKRIQWILTVPAIWSEAAKQIMRFAAKEVTYYNNYNALSIHDLRMAQI